MNRAWEYGLLLLVFAFAPLPAAGNAGHEQAAGPPGGKRMKLTSTAFKHGEAIPRKYTGDGADLSPPLAWTDPPEGVRSFALINDDPDAPAGTWVHWVLYDIPADRRGLAEGLPKQDTVPGTAKHGRTDFRRCDYGGPAPPPGKAHRYCFKLYALDVEMGLAPGATKAELLEAMKGHVLAEAELMGTYRR